MRMVATKPPRRALGEHRCGSSAHTCLGRSLDCAHGRGRPRRGHCELRAPASPPVSIDDRPSRAPPGGRRSRRRRAARSARRPARRPAPRSPRPARRRPPPARPARPPAARPRPPGPRGGPRPRRARAARPPPRPRARPPPRPPAPRPARRAGPPLARAPPPPLPPGPPGPLLAGCGRPSATLQDAPTLPGACTGTRAWCARASTTAVGDVEASGRGRPLLQVALSGARQRGPGVAGTGRLAAGCGERVAAGWPGRGRRQARRAAPQAFVRHACSGSGAMRRRACSASRRACARSASFSAASVADVTRSRAASHSASCRARWGTQGAHRRQRGQGFGRSL